MTHSETNQEAADTGEAIMEATYRALCKHGYVNLTMQAIADEFEKTKAVLYYHYDTKDDLLVAFLDYLLDRFTEQLDIDNVVHPNDRLEALIDELLLGLGDSDDETTESSRRPRIHCRDYCRRLPCRGRWRPLFRGAILSSDVFHSLLDAYACWFRCTPR